jgi:hypothetical protein
MSGRADLGLRTKNLFAARRLAPASGGDKFICLVSRSGFELAVNPTADRPSFKVSHLDLGSSALALGFSGQGQAAPLS